MKEVFETTPSESQKAEMSDQNLSGTDPKIDRTKEDLEDTRPKLSMDEKIRMTSSQWTTSS